MTPEQLLRFRAGLNGLTKVGIDNLGSAEPATQLKAECTIVVLRMVQEMLDEEVGGEHDTVH